MKILWAWYIDNYNKVSGVARAFPGGRAAHPEDQIEEENEEKWGKCKTIIEEWEKMKVESG